VQPSSPEIRPRRNTKRKSAPIRSSSSAPQKDPHPSAIGSESQQIPSNDKRRRNSERNFDSGEFEYSNIRRRIGDAYLKYSNIDIEYSNIWHIRRTRIVLLGLEYSRFRSLRRKRKRRISPPRGQRPFGYAKQPGVGTGHGLKTKKYCLKDDSEMDVEDVEDVEDDGDQDSDYKP